MERRGEHVPGAVWIEALCAVGEVELALDRLDKAVRAREPWTTGIPGDALYAALTDSPRWPAIERISATSRPS